MIDFCVLLLIDSLKCMLVCGSDLLHSFGIPGFWIPEQVRLSSILQWPCMVNS